MNAQRFNELMTDESKLLNHEEVAMGWHFCGDFDGLPMKLGSDGCTCECKGVVE